MPNSTHSGVLERLRPELSALKAYTVPKDTPAIKLDANESPFELPEDVRRELGEVIAACSFHRYPDGSAEALRQALSQHLSTGAQPLDAERILLGVGSDEVITMLMNAFSTSGPDARAAGIVFPSPTFVMYDVSARSHGLRPLPVPMDADFHFDEAAFATALSQEPALAFYATPNNPTGRPIDDAVLRRLIEAFPRTLHVLDEAYGPFERGPDTRPKTRRSWADEYPHVAVMGTLSKVGLAGLRIGYLYAGAVVINELQKVRQPFNLNVPAQVIATHLLTQHHALLESHVRQIIVERERMFSALSARTPIPSMANFHLVKMSAERGQSLRASGIGVRIFRDKALEGWARITIGTPSENDALLAALVD
ncbi:MAG: histidinol-phosphate aminotransferase [Polyangiales bacterium]|jgi:histidinol-phosphate aminotransferase